MYRRRQHDVASAMTAEVAERRPRKLLNRAPIVPTSPILIANAEEIKAARNSSRISRFPFSNRGNTTPATSKASFILRARASISVTHRSPLPPLVSLVPQEIK